MQCWRKGAVEGAGSTPSHLHRVQNQLRFTDHRELPLIIGVISDTHGLLREQAVKVLAGSDHIIHAGDVGAGQVLESLATIAPVTAVRGNVDHAPWARKLPMNDVFEGEGVSIYLLHDLQALDLKPEASGFQAVVYGHSHVPRQETKNGVLFFNPGSAGPRRFHLPVSVGRLHLESGKVRGEIIELGI
jgi:hypothetical protein